MLIGGYGYAGVPKVFISVDVLNLHFCYKYKDSH